MKNAENKASYPYDERKTRKITLRRDTMNKETAKNSFPSRGKRRKQRKMNFSHGGKQKSAEDTFSRLGKRENVENRISQTWGEQKISKTAFPNPWKNKKYCWELFQPLVRAIFPFFIHPRPRTGYLRCSMRSFPPIRLRLQRGDVVALFPRVGRGITDSDTTELAHGSSMPRIIVNGSSVALCYYQTTHECLKLGIHGDIATKECLCIAAKVEIDCWHEVDTI